MRLRDVKIGTQLRIGLGAILALVALLGAVAWVQADRLWQETQGLYDHPLATSGALERLTADVLTMHRDMKDLAEAESDEERLPIIQGIDVLDADAFQQFDALSRSYLGPRSDVEEARRALVQWRSIREETLRLLRAGRAAEAVARTKASGAGGAHVKTLLNDLKTISDFASNKASEVWASAQRERNDLRIMLGWVLGAILLFTLAVSYLLVRGTKDPLDDLTSLAEQFRRGNLNVRSGYTSANEFGALAAAFNALAGTVQEEWQSRESAARVTETMLSREESHAFCRELLTALLEHTGSQAGAVYLLNEQKRDYEHFESVGLSPACRASFSAAGFEGEFGAALATRKIQRITDIPADSRFTFPAVTGDFLPREILTIPVISGADVVAVISLASVRTYGAPAVRLVSDLWTVITARLNGVLALKKIRALAQQLEAQNAELTAQKGELEAQKRELTAQTVELRRQSDILSEQNTELEVQTARVAEANRLKSEFLSNMSHELRTPLNSVLALSRVLQVQGRDQFTSEQTGYLQIIERNGKNLLSLINDILDLAKIESGRLDVACEEFSLGDTITAITESLEPICREKGVALAVNVAPGLPKLWSDPRRVHQILQNIAGNAVKFTREGHVSVTARGLGGEVEIVVEDTGIGIPERDLPHIFDEFRQVDGTSARAFEGTGLGLAIAAKSVRLLGGRIAVKSALGQGSTFSITLPLGTPAPGLPQTPDSHMFPGPSGRTVLVVDDDRADAALIADYLSQAGYGTLIAHSGPEALRLAAAHQPFAITLDVIMPDMDGWEVLQALKRNPATTLIPVIIASMAEDRETGLALGAIGVVSKPVERDALLTEVRRLSPPGETSVLAVDDDGADRGNRVLLVEDSEPAIVQIKMVLEGAGYAVDVARGGQEALSAMAGTPPGGIILDLMMPGMDGLTLLERLRGTPATARTPVLILTAKDLTSDDLARLSANNVRQLIQKGDVDRDELLRQVGNLLGRAPSARAAVEPPGPPPSRPEEPRHPAGLLPVILAVEDNADNMSTLRAMLKDRCVLLEAEDGEEGLNMALSQRPSLILLDLSLPKLDGFTVLGRLKEKEATRAIPVIALTAHAMKSDRERALASGFDGFVVKPIEMEELLEAVEKRVGGRK